MRRPVLLLWCMLVFGCVVGYAADTLTIVHMNDTHSNLSPGGRRNAALQGSIGGIARAATYVGMAKATQSNVLVLHGGDVFIGDLFFQRYYGIAELQLLSAIGVDVMTLGNHEFDLTPSTLLTAFDTAFKAGQSIDIVSANLILDDPAVQRLGTYISPRTTTDMGAVPVGVFGLTTPETNLLSLPAPVVVDTNLVAIAQAQVDSLRAQGCKVVILLSHLGYELDQAIAAYVQGLDLIVGAHSHDIIEADPNATGTPIVQAGAFYHTIGTAHLEVDGDEVRLLYSKVDTLDDDVPEEPSVAVMVAGMIADIESVYGSVYTVAIGAATDDIEQLAEGLDQPGNHDTPLGNLISDAFRTWGNTEIAVEPGGSVAQRLYKGPLVSADAFRAIGYGFNTTNGLGYRMARFTVLGAEMMAGLEFGLSSLANDEFLVQTSGLTYRFDPSAAPYQRLVDVRVGGEPIDPQRRYSVTANEFVVLFFSVLGITPQNVEINTDTTESMVLAGYIQALQEVSPVIEGRIVAGPALSIRDNITSVTHWFDVTSYNGHVEIDLTCPFSEINDVDLFNVTLQHQPISARVIPIDGGTRIAASTADLSSGLYIMRVRVGDCIHAGRVVITR